MIGDVSSEFSPAEFLLHQAVLAEPEADEPRMIYADWLEERGDPRAEFIRVQLELARAPVGSPRWLALKQDELKLLGRHAGRWQKRVHRQLAAAGGPSLSIKRRRWAVRDWRYERGFIEFVDLQAGVFAAFHEAVFAIGPIRGVRLRQVNRASRLVADSPALLRLKTLDVRAVVTSNDLAQLVSSPTIRNLVQLNISYTILFPSAIRALVESPYLAKLQRLQIDCVIYRGGAAASEIHARFGSVAKPPPPLLTAVHASVRQSASHIGRLVSAIFGG